MPKSIPRELEIKPVTLIKFLFITLFVAIAILSFFILRPFINALLTSLVLSYLFFPVYRALYQRTGRRNLSALIVTLSIIVVSLLLLIFVANTLGKEIISFIGSTGWLNTLQPTLGCADQTSLFCATSQDIAAFITNEKYRGYFEFALKAIPPVAQDVKEAAFHIARFALNIFIVFFAMFFIYRDGQAFTKSLEPLLPLSAADRRRIFAQFNDLTYAIVYGNLMTAGLQGLATSLGFWFFGIHSPLLWGFLAAFFALIPFVGASLIWGPAGIYLLATGFSQGNTGVIISGIVLLLYGALVISMIDNILRPKLIGDRANVHPVIVLLGVMGGLGVFGFIGVVLGPVILAFLITFTEIFKKEILRK